MGRPLRIEYEHAVYHIISRGNERRAIFLDKTDFQTFLQYLQVLHDRYKVLIWSYVLMDNHYHLLLQTPLPNLRKIMRDLNGCYTLRFNKRHKRCGHLFQGRYKSILVEKDVYLWQLSKYIHLNPVRARITSMPEQYAYSSMQYYVGNRPIPPWLDTSAILNQEWGPNLPSRQQAYKRFVHEQDNHTENILDNVYAQAILGSEKFIKHISTTFLSGKPISDQIPQRRKLQYAQNLRDILDAVIEISGIPFQQLISRKVKFNMAKKCFIYCARTYTDCTLTDMRDILDNSITESSISSLFLRTKREMLNSPQLQNLVHMVETRLFPPAST